MALPTYKQEYKSLSAEYDPQTKLINSQIAQLAPQQTAQEAALEQAKVNAFSDITKGANARGVMFSGVPIDQQAQYVGTKYLPAVANVKSTFQNNRNTLLGQINALTAQRVQEAKSNVSAAQKNAADAAYKQALLQIKQQQLAISASKAARSASGGTAASRAAAKQSEMSGAANQINSYFKKNKLIGSDGYLSPYKYNDALSAWVQDGFTKSQFEGIFGHYKNPKTKGYQ